MCYQLYIPNLMCEKLTKNQTHKNSFYALDSAPFFNGSHSQHDALAHMPFSAIFYFNTIIVYI